jgi:hypothetical protein
VVLLSLKAREIVGSRVIPLLMPVRTPAWEMDEDLQAMPDQSETLAEVILAPPVSYPWVAALKACELVLQQPPVEKVSPPLQEPRVGGCWRIRP